MTDIHDEAAGRAMVARTEFTNESVWLPLLAVNHLNAGETVISGKTFTDCIIEGPAVLVALNDVSLDGCNMGLITNPMNLMFKPLGDLIIGAVGVSHCRFVRCRFVQIGFTGPEAFLTQLADSITSAAGQPGEGV